MYDYIHNFSNMHQLTISNVIQTISNKFTSYAIKFYVIKSSIFVIIKLHFLGLQDDEI